MKNTVASVLFFLLLTTLYCHAANSSRQFSGKGEVITVDPVYSQITISHESIKGFAQEGETEFYVTEAGETEFYVTEAAILKGVTKGDLVDFELTDTKGDVKIDKIVKTGIAPPKDDGMPLGQALRDTLQGAGDVLGAVTAPIPPVSEAFHGAMASTADVADPKIEDGKLKQKTSF